MFVQPLLFTLYSVDCTPRHQESSIMKYGWHRRSIVIPGCLKTVRKTLRLGNLLVFHMLPVLCDLVVNWVSQGWRAMALSKDVRCETKTWDTGESSCRLAQVWVYYSCTGHQRLVFSCHSKWFLSHNQESFTLDSQGPGFEPWLR